MNKRIIICGFVVVVMIIVSCPSTWAQNAKKFYLPRVSQSPVTQAIWPADALYRPDPLVYSNVSDFQEGVALMNDGQVEGTIVLTARAEDGSVLKGNGVTNPSAPIRLAPGTQRAFYLTQALGQGIVGQKAWVEISATGGDIKGLFFSFDGEFNYLSGGGILGDADAGIRIILLKSRSTGRDIDAFQYDRELDICNPNNAPAKVTLIQWSQHDPDSVLYTPIVLLDSAVIKPHGKIQEKVPGSDVKRWRIDSHYELLSDVSVLVSERELRNFHPVLSGPVIRTIGMEVVNGMPVEKAAIRKEYTNVALPHATAGNGWFTRINMIRIGDWIRKDGKLFGGPGGPIEYMAWDQWGKDVGKKWNGWQWPQIGLAPRNRLILSIDELIEPSVKPLNGSFSLAITSGSWNEGDGLVYLTEFGPTINIQGKDLPLDDFTVVIPPIPPTTSATLPHIAEGGIFGTGFAGRDGRVYRGYPPWPQVELNQVVVDVFSAEGQRLCGAEFSLHPGEKFAKTVQETCPNLPLPQSGGSVKIHGTLPFQSFGIYWVMKEGRIVAASMIPQQ